MKTIENPSKTSFEGLKTSKIRAPDLVSLSMFQGEAVVLLRRLADEHLTALAFNRSSFTTLNGRKSS